MIGVFINGSSHNTIGGASSGEGNIISGQTNYGIDIDGATATGNKVIGNYIGTDATGTLDRGNSVYGILITTSATNNTIGGTTAAERNIISGNNEYGIFITAAPGNKISGNFIGTTVSGTAALGNTLGGIAIVESANNIVGGSSAGERNIISGNSKNGVDILHAGSTGNKVTGNYIGTDVNGTSVLGNTLDGVFIVDAPGNTVGGTTPGERNIISGNNRGILISNPLATGNKILGNFIGTNASGTSDLGNTTIGITISNAPNNSVGGTTAGERNVISGNDSSGVSNRANKKRYNEGSENTDQIRQAAHGNAGTETA